MLGPPASHYSFILIGLSLPCVCCFYWLFNVSTDTAPTALMYIILTSCRSYKQTLDSWILQLVTYQRHGQYIIPSMLIILQSWNHRRRLVQMSFGRYCYKVHAPALYAERKIVFVQLSVTQHAIVIDWACGKLLGCKLLGCGLLEWLRLPLLETDTMVVCSGVS